MERRLFFLECRCEKWWAFDFCIVCCTAIISRSVVQPTCAVHEKNNREGSICRHIGCQSAP